MGGIDLPPCCPNPCQSPVKAIKQPIHQDEKQRQPIGMEQQRGNGQQADGKAA